MGWPGDTGPMGLPGKTGATGPQGPKGDPTTVNGIAADGAGNIQLTAGQVGAVSSPPGRNLTLWVGSQSDYDAIANKDADTLYCVTG